MNGLTLNSTSTLPVPDVRAWLTQSWSEDERIPQRPESEKRVAEDPKADFGTGARMSEQARDGRKNARDIEEMKPVVEEIQSHLESLNIKLNFKIDQKRDELIIKVIDADHDEVIRQIPPEGLLDLRNKLEELRGIIFDQKV